MRGLPRLQIRQLETPKDFLFQQLYFLFGFFLEDDTLFPLTHLLFVLEVHLPLQVRLYFGVDLQDVPQILNLEVAWVLDNLQSLRVVHEKPVCP